METVGPPGHLDMPPPDRTQNHDVVMMLKSQTVGLTSHSLEGLRVMPDRPPVIVGGGR